MNGKGTSRHAAPFLTCQSRLKRRLSEFSKSTRLLLKHGFVFTPGVVEVQASSSAESYEFPCTHLLRQSHKFTHFHRCTHGIVSDTHPLEQEVLSDVECAACNKRRSRTPVFSERDGLKALLFIGVDGPCSLIFMRKMTSMLRIH